MRILIFLYLIGIKSAFCFINTPISTDSRIRILIYREDSIYSLIFLPDMNARIKFVKGERIRSIMIGDRSNWELKVMDDNCLYIRPLRINLKTNMMIDTDKRSYIVDLESSDSDY